MSKLTSVLRQFAETANPRVDAVAPLSETERLVADNTVSRLNAIEEAVQQEIATDCTVAECDVESEDREDLSFVEEEPHDDFAMELPSSETEAPPTELMDELSAPSPAVTEVMSEADARQPEVAAAEMIVADVSAGHLIELPEKAPISPVQAPRDQRVDPGIAALRDRLVADVAPWEQGRLLMLVSIDAQSDRTNLIADLAQALAGVAEGKVLAVDATDRTADDFADEDADDWDPPRPGLDSILTAGRLDPEAIQPTSTDGLDMLGRGRDGLLARKLNDELVVRTTAALREQYDFVLVDGGDWGNSLVPRLAGHMDAIYLCVQANWSTEASARRAIRQLERTGVRVSGCVLLGGS